MFECTPAKDRLVPQRFDPRGMIIIVVVLVETKAIGFFEHAAEGNEMFVDGRLRVADIHHAAAELAGLIVMQMMPREFICGFNFSI